MPVFEAEGRSPALWSTHTVVNQVPEWANDDLWDADVALREAVEQAGAHWAAERLQTYARQVGSPAARADAVAANVHGPQHRPYDARGHRLDAVDFHPAWHHLLGLLRQGGWVTLPWRDDRPGRWTAWAAGFYLHGQIEQGTLCPATMTQAAVPLLRREPALWAQVGDPLLSDAYDPRDIPLPAKASIWVGMGMTEKQGGSDVRANTTTAWPLDGGGRGGVYRVRGHKWFYSAPSSDAHLVSARIGPDGPMGCFWVPRWWGAQRNAVRIQRLKDKLGNRSNASGEVEFEDALGILIGEEGRGIATLVEMASYTRINCVLGSAAIVRAALVQALHSARHRQAFGRALAQQPAMRGVLLDLALESEAALQLGLRLAQACEDATPLDQAWRRIVTPAAKFWVCKRAIAATAEAMEVLGGNGYVEEGTLARLLREAPVNSIWEGSGNVMCLDVLRAVQRQPQAAHALLNDWRQALHGDAAALGALHTLAAAWQTQTDGAALEHQARWIAQTLALLAQAVLLRTRAPTAVADAFIATRLGEAAVGQTLGVIDARPWATDAILARALPEA